MRLLCCAISIAGYHMIHYFGDRRAENAVHSFLLMGS
jgi:hypothetical protein